MIETAAIQPRRESTDDRRAAIARAARQLIVEKGVEGLRTRDIAERVGINIATLHYHVPTKEALIELVAESLHQFFRGQAVARPRAHLSARERMDLEFVDFREAALEKPEIILVFSELMERARRDERIAEAILPLKRAWRQMLVDMLTEGVRDGDYRQDMDPDACATLVMSSMIGFCRNRHKDAASYERLVAELQRAIRNPNRDAERLARSQDRATRRAPRISKEQIMSSQFHPPANKAEADPRRWVALAVLLIASFMNLIDVTIVNVAIPSMQQNLGADANQIEWVIAAYVLAFALGLLPFGRLGDIVGRTHMFLIGVAAFTVASAACGLAPSIEWLIAARVVQGLAGAIMTPQVLAIATVTFPPEERGQSFSLFGLSAGLAAVAGPIVGGLLIGANLGGLDWRPIFLVNVPVGILALVLGWFIIPRPPGHPDLKNDFVGIGLFAASMVALVYPLIEGRAYDWPWWTWTMIAASVVLLAMFVLWERRMAASNQPQLLNFSLMSNPNFLLGALITTIFASGVPAFFMVISIMLQVGFDLTPIQSGLTNTPFSVGVLLVSLVAGRFGSHYLRTRVAISGALLVTGILWTHFVILGLGDSVDHWTFLPPLLIAGVGLGLGFSALFQTVLAGIPPRDAGSGAGALQAFQQVGGSIGVALVGTIFFGSLGNIGALFQSGPAAVHEGFAKAAASATWYQIATFGAVIVLVFFLKGRGPVTGQGEMRAPAGPPIPAEA